MWGDVKLGGGYLFNGVLVLIFVGVVVKLFDVFVVFIIVWLGIKLVYCDG